MKPLSRLLRLLLNLCILAATISACAAPAQETPVVQSIEQTAPAPTDTQAPTLPPPSKYQQAPELAARVEKCELPPVDERLPENPLVVQSAENVGQYGGVWRMGMLPKSDGSLFMRTVLYEGLVAWSPDWSGIQPNIAESYEVSPDASTYTFHLRKGMKWSDGKPFTSADIQFWWEDVIQNNELTPEIPEWLKANGELPKLTFPDETTVVFQWPAGYGLFLSHLASTEGLEIAWYQADWSKQYHVKYTGNKKGWVDTFWKMNTWGEDPTLPFLTAWMTVEPYGKAGTQMTWVRNPYYWKVDPKNNQLPYLDQVVFSVVDNVDEIVEMAANGKIDMQDRHLNTAPYQETISGNAAKGDYRLFTTYNTSLNRMTLMFNLNSSYAPNREIFNNKDFRIGMSYAINRQKIIDTLYGGQGEPWQTAPLPSSPLYDEEMAKQYVEYSIEKANEHLDKAGYLKDASGKRIGPDGKPIKITVEVTQNSQEWIDTLAMVVKDWAEVGVDVQVKAYERNEFFKRIYEFNSDASVWSTGGSLAETLLEPRYFVPVSEALWAPAWNMWFFGEQISAENIPPDDVQEALQLYRTIQVTADPDEQERLAKQIVQFAKEHFWTIGIATAPDGYGIVKNNLHNVVDHPGSWIYPNPAPTHPESWYFDPPQE